MTYTWLAVVAVLVALGVDRWVLGTGLAGRSRFWLAYLIIGFFQLVTNGVLTGQQVVRYRDDTILGVGNDVADPVLIGAGRFVFAPIEDLLFGFSFVLLVLAVWVWLGRRGIQPEPRSGPPMWRSR